jgi:hypothetical protein
MRGLVAGLLSLLVPVCLACSAGGGATAASSRPLHACAAQVSALLDQEKALGVAASTIADQRVGAPGDAALAQQLQADATRLRQLDWRLRQVRCDGRASAFVDAVTEESGNIVGAVTSTIAGDPDASGQQAQAAYDAAVRALAMLNAEP